MHAEYPPLNLEQIRSALAHAPIGHTLLYHATVASTMPIAAAAAQEPSTPSGVVVIAEEQTSGRGRRGRTWHAPYASALLVSLILKPPHTASPAALTIAAGNALLAAVAAVAPELAGELRLKWPNDLVLGSDPTTARKLAGILAESSINPDGTLAYAILGIGVNVNQQSRDLPRIAPPTPRPTSLHVASGRIINRSELFIHLCHQLAHELTLPPAESYRRWKTRLATLGQRVAVYQQGVEAPATLTGLATDTQEDGALIVLDDSGTRHTFHAADISIRAT